MIAGAGLMGGGFVVGEVTIRLAVISERAELEALQRRVSLENPVYREALMAHPDAIELPLEQIALGDVFVAELDGVVVGFAALQPRAERLGCDCLTTCRRGRLAR